MLTIWLIYYKIFKPKLFNKTFLYIFNYKRIHYFLCFYEISPTLEILTFEKNSNSSKYFLNFLREHLVYNFYVLMSRKKILLT